MKSHNTPVLITEAEQQQLNEKIKDVNKFSPSYSKQRKHADTQQSIETRTMVRTRTPKTRTRTHKHRHHKRRHHTQRQR